MGRTPAQFVIGWEEWLALPDLGLPAIKAKVDTGARSSALHAFTVESYGPPSAPMVRFGIHPIPGRHDIEVFCVAPVVGRRQVTSSNGEKETRFFIRSTVAIGDRKWPIEIGLANRETMTYRMLLGRQAICSDMIVDPAASFLQPRMSYRLYGKARDKSRSRKLLRIALLTRGKETQSERHLARAAGARGHLLERIDIASLKLELGGDKPGLRRRGAALDRYDALIPRLGVAEGRLGAAIVRQLEMAGSYSVNSADALDTRANSFALKQKLTAAGIAHRIDRKSDAGKARSSRFRSDIQKPSALEFVRVLLVGGRVIAASLRGADTRKRLGPAQGHTRSQAVNLAERVATVLGLGLVSIDVETDPPCVIAIRTRPSLPSTPSHETSTAAEVLELIETNTRFRR